MSFPDDIDDLMGYFDLDTAVANAGGVAAGVAKEDALPPPPPPPAAPTSPLPLQRHRSQPQSQPQPGPLDLSTLKDKFGHSAFKALQWSAIAAVAQGKYE